MLRHKITGCVIAILTIIATVLPANAQQLAAGRQAPGFALTDVSGHKQSLTSIRGRPAVLCFFCGCDACMQIARLWGQIQRSNVLTPSIPTLIIYSGDAESARSFLATSGLSPAATIALPDPDSSVTRVYGVQPCPRIFVLDANGTVRYTNDGADDAPQKAAASVIAVRVVGALQELQPKIGVGQARPTAAPQGASPAGGIELIREPGLNLSDATHAAIKFGEIDPLTTDRLVKIVHLRNRDKAQISIGVAQSSCGCAAGVMTRGGKPVESLGPGKTADLRITLDITRLHAGPFTKALLITVKGMPGTAAWVELSGKVRPLIAFDPPAAEFGRVASGTQKTIKMTATLDQRILAGGTPSLVSSDPGVQIDPPQIGKGAGSFLIAAYTLRITPSAHLGQLRGTLSFLPPAAAKPNPRVAALWSSNLVPLIGEVTGSLSASPSTIVFGAISAGKPATREVTLTAVSPGTLRELRVSSASPMLSTTLRSVGPTTAILKVSVGPNLPQGAMNTQITLTTAAGETLVIPVLASAQ